MLSSIIRKEMRTPQNARFLHSLPQFKTDDDLPEMLADLLGQLDEAEAPRRSRKERKAGGASRAARPRRSRTSRS